MGDWITLDRADGSTLRAYRATPEGGSQRSIVVIQEIFGVNAHIRDVCDRFAKAGFTATAPALFDRVQPDVELDYSPEGVKAGIDLMSQIKPEDALADIALVAQAAKTPVATVGYCWGGSLSYACAARMPNTLACAVSYYGGGVGNMLDEAPQCPVMFHFGAEDKSIPLDTVDKVRAALPDAPVFVYEGAGHGFSCDVRASYHAESAAIATARTLDFLNTHMPA